jgi:hypothetical protein
MSSMRAEKRAQLESAITWLHENPTETVVTSAGIHQVHPDTLRIELKRRSRIPTDTRRNDNGRKVGSGGQNRLLSDAQNTAIRSYCKQQFEGGLGATKSMVYGAITFLLSQ